VELFRNPSGSFYARLLGWLNCFQGGGATTPPPTNPLLQISDPLQPTRTTVGPVSRHARIPVNLRATCARPTEWRMSYAWSWLCTAFDAPLKINSAAKNKFSKSGRRNPRSQKQRPSKQRTKQRPTPSVRVDPYTAMLIDPCNAPLVPGAYGNTSFKMRRLTSEISFTVAAGNTTYYLWMPKYHCLATFSKPVNLIVGNGFGGAVSVNTVALPYGCGGSNTNSANDPARDFVNTSTVRDARTVAACMDLTFTGRTDAASGTITKIPAVKLSSFFRNVSGTPSFTGYTFDQLYALGGESMRPGRTTQIRSAPDFVDTEFVPVDHSPLTLGTPASAATTIDEDHLRDEDPSMFGFCIRAGTDSQTYSLKFTKLVEYREEDIIFGLATTAVQSAAALNGPPPLQRAVAKLDSSFPNWHTDDGIVSRLKDLSGITSFAKSAIGLYKGMGNAISGASVLPRALRAARVAGYLMP
jgi:hypothetical protein